MGIKLIESKLSEKCPSTLDMKPVERTLQIIVAFLHDNNKNLEGEEEDSMKNKSNLLLYYFVSETCDKNDTLQNLCIETFGKSREILKCESEMFELGPSSVLAVLRIDDGVFTYDHSAFTMAIRRLVTHVLEMSFQDITPTLAKLRIGIRDLLSPTPKKPSHRKVKRAVLRDREKELEQPLNNLLFVVLGWSGRKPALTIEAYLPRADKWFYIPQKTFIKRAYHGVVIIGVMIYIIGGFDGKFIQNNTFCFHIEKRKWYSGPDMIEPRCYVTALSFKGVVYALGGFDGRERLESCEKFDPRSTQWKHIADMNVSRSDASGAVHKGKMYMCGGFDGDEIQSTAEVYDPDMDQWTLIGDMLGPRSGHVLISYQQSLLVIGGYDGETRLRTVECYDEEKKTFVEHVPLNHVRSNFAAAVVEDQLHVIGGYNGTCTFSEVERFDDKLNVWRKIKDLGMHRSAHGACVFRNPVSVSMCSIPEHILVRPFTMEEQSP